MISIPTNDHTALNHPLLSFTPHQLETQDKEVPTFNGSITDDLFDLGDFGVDTGLSVFFSSGPPDSRMAFGVVATPRAPPHGILPRHVNPLVRQRRLINIRRGSHLRSGSNPRVSRSQTTSFDAPSQANILAAVAPQLNIDPFHGAYTLNTHPSASLSAVQNSTMFDRVPQSHIEPGVLAPQVTPPSTNFDGFPQSSTHAVVTPQLTIDGASDPINRPSVSRIAGSSSASFDGGKQLSLSSIENENIPIHMMSGLVPEMAPTLASSSPLKWMTSTPRTPKPLGHPWDVSAASRPAAYTTSVASERAGPSQVPASCCLCSKRAHPFVRVDDTIEWIRRDVMKMVLYFNWSPNAEAEAHESWEPRGAGPNYMPTGRNV